ncbi:MULTISPECIES: DUF3221 domain-containing protein [Bacillus]|uniref:DUF3221 domain-containing protein n=1 Tax=Bacillus anthracis TaxID=1392 RepID=A0A2A7DDP1_BACAN|nr:MULTISPECIES: DUF3221 domain-containing protein [Bacillus]MCP1162405.1 DUF3221 domain-containing protein [Bacillus sp. 1813sda1]PDZ18112.1 DUF3221 domain-containing protein [Bacillus anthracis]
MPKKKIITLVTTLTLACGCTVALDPPNQANTTSLKTETFTGYVIAIDTVYILVADTPTKKEALSYSEAEAIKFIPNKLLKLPIEKNKNYQLGDKLFISFGVTTKSTPSIATDATIEKIRD